jgi:hypothetical protein
MSLNGNYINYLNVNDNLNELMTLKKIKFCNKQWWWVHPNKSTISHFDYKQNVGVLRTFNLTFRLRHPEADIYI